jgi:hypothetical protein
MLRDHDLEVARGPDHDVARCNPLDSPAGRNAVDADANGVGERGLSLQLLVEARDGTASMRKPGSQSAASSSALFIPRHDRLPSRYRLRLGQSNTSSSNTRTSAATPGTRSSANSKPWVIVATADDVELSDLPSKPSAVQALAGCTELAQDLL